jgi:hypothetical protein
MKSLILTNFGILKLSVILLFKIVSKKSVHSPLAQNVKGFNRSTSLPSFLIRHAVVK